MQWISIKDKLPEKYGIYIGCDADNVDPDSESFICDYICDPKMLEKSEVQGFYIDTYSYGEVDGRMPIKVTHWMNFPNPPSHIAQCNK